MTPVAYEQLFVLDLAPVWINLILLSVFILRCCCFFWSQHCLCSLIYDLPARRSLLWFELTLLWTPSFPHQGSVMDFSFLHHRPFWGLFMKEESTPILWMNNDHTHKPDVEFDLSIFVLLRCKQNAYALFLKHACDHLAGRLISDEA